MNKLTPIPCQPPTDLHLVLLQLKKFVNFLVTFGITLFPNLQKIILKRAIWMSLVSIDHFQDFDFWPKFWFSVKILIFDQNFDIRLKFWFWPKFWFFVKICIFGQNFDFLSKFSCSTSTFSRVTTRNDPVEEHRPVRPDIISIPRKPPSRTNSVR